MTTKRTPIARAGRMRIGPLAVDAFKARERTAAKYSRCIDSPARCDARVAGEHCPQCTAHLDANMRLIRALGLKPWQDLDAMPELLLELKRAAKATKA